MSYEVKINIRAGNCRGGRTDVFENLLYIRMKFSETVAALKTQKTLNRRRSIQKVYMHKNKNKNFIKGVGIRDKFGV